MANVFSTDADASDKSYSTFMPYSPPVLVGGVIQHALFTVDTQTAILRVVDETGRASLGDIVENVGGHSDPAAAVLVMVDLGILEIDYHGVVDQHSIVRRAPSSPPPTDQAVAHRPPQEASRDDTVALPAGVENVVVSPFTPSITVTAGHARRVLDKMDVLSRPGIYALLGENQVYIGTSASVGNRVASGQQPIGDIKSVVVITDKNNALTEEDAKAAERILYARIQASGEFAVMNELPMGARIGIQRFGEIDAFLGQVCLALRYRGIMFTDGTARSVLAGPRAEMGRVAQVRAFDRIPNGTRVEMCFDGGLVAQAARRSDNHWVLLAGSDIRIETAASANSSVRFLRSAWTHAGLLEISANGRSLVTQRDLVFKSGSGCAQFCVGSKGRSINSWEPVVGPDDGFDPHTAALIAA